MESENSWISLDFDWIKMEKYCRACMKITKINIAFSNNFMENENLKIGDIFYRISRLKPNDNFSQKICLECFNELTSCYEFQQKCIDSHQKFRKTNKHSTNEDSFWTEEEEHFNSVDNLIESIIIEESFECRTCNSTCSCEGSMSQKLEDNLKLHHEKELIEHKQENHDPTSYQCRHCPKKLANKKSRAAHMWRHKYDQINTTCEDISRKDLLLKNDDTDLENDQYDDRIKQENHHDSMNEEVNNSKSIGDSYQCLHCPKIFYNMSSRAAHMWRHKYDDIKETSENIFNKELLAEINESDLQNVQNDNADDMVGNDYTIKRKQNKNYYCDYCGIFFDRKTRLEKHKKHHNPEGKPFECEVCKFRFTTKHRLNEHELRHIKEQTKIGKHKKSKGGKPASKKELLLLSQIARKAALKSQRSMDRKQTYKCQFCPEKFSALTNLIRHFAMNLHDDQPRYKCVICSECFELKKEMIEHLQWHISKRKISCRICEKSFSERCHLKSHMRSHDNERRHLCEECGSGFKTATNLRDHMLLHTGEKPFKCEQCPAKFASRGSLHSHQVLHTKVRAFSCELCSSKFTVAYSLKKHMLIHTGERPFACSTCTMTFRSSDVRNRHMLIHTGEKPHVCKFCSRAFTQKNDLTKHLKSHLGEKIYNCDKCSESFRLQLELREHLYEHYRLEKENGEIEN